MSSIICWAAGGRLVKGLLAIMTALALFGLAWAEPNKVVEVVPVPARPPKANEEEAAGAAVLGTTALLGVVPAVPKEKAPAGDRDDDDNDDDAGAANNPPPAAVGAGVEMGVAEGVVPKLNADGAGVAGVEVDATADADADAG